MGRYFQGHDGGWNAPARHCATGTTNGVVTPSNETIYASPIRCLRVGGAGNVVIVLDGDSVDDATKYVTIPVEANEELTSFAIRQVRATGTTATGLLGFT